MMGATGAVGRKALEELQQNDNAGRITLLGRNSVPDVKEQSVRQHKIDIFDPGTYIGHLAGHEIAICTLGVGQPSKVSRVDFINIDKLAVLNFAKHCKTSGVQHFELLSSVGANSKSVSFYLRTKGELIDGLGALNFERLSIFQPSMILTSKNRYGIMQAITLKIWPLLSPLLIGSLKKYRGIRVGELGKAMASNIFLNKKGVEILQWDDFKKLIEGG